MPAHAWVDPPVVQATRVEFVAMGITTKILNEQAGELSLAIHSTIIIPPVAKIVLHEIADG